MGTEKIRKTSIRRTTMLLLRLFMPDHCPIFLGSMKGSYTKAPSLLKMMSVMNNASSMTVTDSQCNQYLLEVAIQVMTSKLMSINIIKDRFMSIMMAVAGWACPDANVKS